MLLPNGVAAKKRKWRNANCTNRPQRQSTQPKVVAIFVMDTDMREIAHEFSRVVDAIVSEWDILEFYYKDKLVY